LNVITIQVPPLREKHEDVPVLAQHFLRVYAAKNNRQLDGFSDEALGCLQAYSWPGNVRELENVVERAVVLARGARVDVADLPDAVRERPVMLTRGGPPAAGDGSGAAAVPEGVFQIRVGTPLAEVEARLLEETLRLNHGNKTLTAKMLGIDPKTVFRKLKQGEAEEGAP
jgi:two-component system response regulator HydG